MSALLKSFLKHANWQFITLCAIVKEQAFLLQNLCLDIPNPEPFYMGIREVLRHIYLVYFVRLLIPPHAANSYIFYY